MNSKCPSKSYLPYHLMYPYFSLAFQQQESAFTGERSSEASVPTKNLKAPMLDDVDDMVVITSAEQCLNETESLLKSSRPESNEAAEKVRLDGRPRPGPARRKRKRKSSSSESDVRVDDDEDHQPKPQRLTRRTGPPSTQARSSSASGNLVARYRYWMSVFFHLRKEDSRSLNDSGRKSLRTPSSHRSKTIVIARQQFWYVLISDEWQHMFRNLLWRTQLSFWMHLMYKL